MRIIFFIEFIKLVVQNCFSTRFCKSIFQLPGFAEVFEGHVQTVDNVSIAFDTYKTNHDEVVILAHGWFMTKNSNAFTKMAEDFSKYYDVIVLTYK